VPPPVPAQPAPPYRVPSGHPSGQPYGVASAPPYGVPSAPPHPVASAPGYATAWTPRALAVRLARMPGVEGIRRLRWNLWLPIGIAFVTITGAVLTYLSIALESTASSYDRLAVVQQVLVQARDSGAQSQAHAYSGLAAQYRAMLAEADAIEGTDPERAAALRAVATSFGTQAGIAAYLTGESGELRFDYDLAYLSALHNRDAIAPPDNQPMLTAARAHDYHARSRTLAATVVVMLAVVVLLTLARLYRRNRVRVPLVAAAGAAYLVAIVVALANLG
jgi:hypothetical protein